MVMLDNRLQTRHALSGAYFLYLKVLRRLSPRERKKSRMAAAATTHTINNARSRSAYGHETEVSLNRGRKGPMRIDELGH